MRFSQRIIGIAAVAALAAGMSTVGRVDASTGSGTQIEYIESAPTTFAYQAVAMWRAFAASYILSAF